MGGQISHWCSPISEAAGLARQQMSEEVATTLLKASPGASQRPAWGKHGT